MPERGGGLSSVAAFGPPRFRVLAFAVTLAAGCTRTPPPSSDPNAGDAALRPAPALSRPDPPTGELPPGARSCTGPGGPTCLRFDSVEAAFRRVLVEEPRVLAIGEAHAQRGTEHLASSTRRFTERLLPLLAPRTSDIVVELWAPDPKCAREVKAVASAQKPVTDVQAAENQNEYVTLGTAAKAAGVVPWLLRPTCEDFAFLADAGDDATSAMLALVKRLTQSKVTQLHERNRAAALVPPKMLVAYGGAMHNDLSPPDATRIYSFGPELDRLTEGRYVELDLIVPEYVKRTPAWQKLPWYEAFETDRERGIERDATTLYAVGERSFVIVFPWTARPSREPTRDD